MLAIATTTCDQMRYAAALAAGDDQGCTQPVFLMNIPRTWQTEVARQVYRDELRRLGRFFQRLGGRAPRPADLAAVMQRYDAARQAWRDRPAGCSARQYAEALAWLRGPLEEPEPAPPSVAASATHRMAAGTHPASIAVPADCFTQGTPEAGVRVALVGGPLLHDDYRLYDLIEQAGARIVVDGTEGGPRTLPRPFDPHAIESDPFEELAQAYFDAFLDAMRRPNSPLYHWLSGQITSQQVQGIIVHRYVWCDLWHAEVARLAARCGLPVLDLDAAGPDAGTWPRILTRVEAFLESLVPHGSAAAATLARQTPLP